jgi:hypothetical protein
MLQPTGPQARAGVWDPPPPPPTRAAAGRDIWRDTFAPPQLGHFTSASSDFRMTSSSNDFPQGEQAYS